MPTAYEDRYAAQAASTNTDQTEWDALRQMSVVIDAGVRDDTISGALDEVDVGDASEDGPSGRAAWVEADLRLDSQVGGIREEIERRIVLLGSAYPFELSGQRLVYRASRSGFYEFCLAICRARTITTKPYTQLPRNFERLTAKLLEAYMGADAESLHVGWPRDNSVGRTFKAAMKHLERQPYEWIWSPETGKPEDPPTRYAKDEGIDFVVQKKLLDERAGRLYILGQCACGDEWPTKWSELTQDRLNKWFRTVTLVPFVRAFVTPYLLTDEMLREATSQAGLVFDRARLAKIAELHLGESQISELARHTQPMAQLVVAA
ncbi:hypothetical protein [[Pseudomonas] boreopolis]|uniref:hypothetical protein n=1 Tax=Xanthomonas boreopolis TaxID=86183 RepID=UPI003D52A0EE